MGQCHLSMVQMRWAVSLTSLQKAEDGQLHGSIFGQYNRADRGDGKTSTVTGLTYTVV